MNRRSFLKSAAIAVVAAPSVAKLSFAQDAAKLRVQLGWIANVEYGAHWIALDKGLFTAAGLDVTVTPGGPNAPDPLTLVAAGNTDVGYTSWLPFLDAVKLGNDYVLIGAAMQTSPLGIISLAKKPILEAKDIVGSKILVQGPAEQTAIEATLALNGLPAKDWTMVPAGFSPEPLVAGDGDGYTAFATNQTITLEGMGLVRDKDFFFRSFDELGFPSYAGLAFVKRDFLTANRGSLVKYVQSLIRAQLLNEADPTLAPKLVIDKYGADYGLNIDQQMRQNQLQMPFFRPGADPNYHLFKLDKEKMAGSMYAAAKTTGRTDLPDIDKIVDASIAEEAFAGL
ncbi:ABC transporter substrate-binding protein [Rhizobium sp. CF142]|uniref:ABC transporter substrate-binding protein n=1 Tax=Rhizobium sp. CF142 TaxID=1144314 RepID=UPI00026F008C|nr:ABC transporter substrate-binding protein [Rhizobium sp. CF142]EJJ29824.1 ABC-type nitrate/sulfonate/bicarbonate transport system, periplasmic component [Rhizobium sp. CF142]